MMLTPHILVGTAIGYKIHSYWFIIIFSIISHFILDAVPHKEYNISHLRSGKLSKDFLKDFSKVVLDGLVGLTLGLLLTGFKDLDYVIVGMIAGAFPDFLQFLSFIFNSKILNSIRKFHHKIHIFNNKDFPFWTTLGSQVSTVILITITLLS